MSKYHDAANVLKREAQRYEALSMAAAALDEIGGMDQAASEAKSRADAAIKEADAAKVALAKLKLNVTKIEAEQADIINATNLQAKQQMDIAKVEAEKIISAAKNEGVRINQIATDSAKSTTEQAAKSCEDIANKCRVLADELAMREKAIAESNAEAEAAELRLAKVKAAIAKLSAE